MLRDWCDSCMTEMNKRQKKKECKKHERFIKALASLFVPATNKSGLKVNVTPAKLAEIKKKAKY